MFKSDKPDVYNDICSYRTTFPVSIFLISKQCCKMIHIPPPLPNRTTSVLASSKTQPVLSEVPFKPIPEYLSREDLLEGQPLKGTSI